MYFIHLHFVFKLLQTLMLNLNSVKLLSLTILFSDLAAARDDLRSEATGATPSKRSCPSTTWRRSKTYTHSATLPNERSARLTCTYCNPSRLFSNKSNLNRHIISIHKNIQIYSDVVLDSHYKCSTCGDKFLFRGDLVRHRLRSHPSNQGGLQNFGFWEEDSDPELKTEHVTNESLIFAPIVYNKKAYSIYNHPLPNPAQFVHLDSIMQFVDSEILIRHDKAFKINISFSMILYNTRSGTYRDHVPHSNSFALSDHFLLSKVGNIPALREVIQLALNNDINLRNRPDTRWKLIMLTNVRFHVFPTVFS